MTYNLTNLTNANTFLGVVKETNNAVGGSFMAMTILALWFIIFIASKRYSTWVSVFTASFICSIVSTLFVFSGLLPMSLYSIIITILSISIFIGVWWRN